MRRVYHSVIKPYVSWQGALAAACLALLILVYFYRLGDLTPGMSPLEIESVGASSTKAELLENPLYAPHKVITYGFTKLKIYSPEALRGISATFVILVVIAFYQLLKKWHSRRIALLTTVLFASSSWLLAVGRHASPTALLLVWFVLLVGIFWFKHYARRKATAYLLAIIFVAALYIPTAPYIMAIFAVLYAKRIFKFMQKLGPGHIAGVSGMVAVLLLPLVYAFAKNPSLIRDWLLIPSGLTPRVMLNNFIALPKLLIYAAPHNPEFWLSRLPLLDLFSGTMLLLGTYSYRYHLRMKRTPLVWACVVVATLIVGLAGINAAIILLPFLYIIIGNGISFMLGQWFQVFPKNPLARSLGTVLLILGVSVACFYQFSRYFVAWPKAPATRELYSIRQ